MDIWTTIGPVGYLGSKRDATLAAWDAEHGPGNWRMSWQVNGARAEFAQAVMLYEDAYYAFLAANPTLLDALCLTARDVYDDSPTNLASGLDYTIQETGRTHLQDIAIRRCVTRLGRRLEGSELVQIRDHLAENPFSMPLSPGQVPFHQPGWIREPQIAGWWLPGSVESFYQSNRDLQVRG